MNNTIKNILAVIAGIIVGSIVNMAIIMVSNSIIPLPEGVNPSDMESLKNSMHLFEPKHFIFPFLAHAIGTLVGAIIAALIAGTKKMVFAFVISGWFLLGGIANLFLLPGPMWFNVTDITFAYIPMGWFGYKIGNRK